MVNHIIWNLAVRMLRRMADQYFWLNTRYLNGYGSRDWFLYLFRDRDKPFPFPDQETPAKPSCILQPNSLFCYMGGRISVSPP